MRCYRDIFEILYGFRQTIDDSYFQEEEISVVAGKLGELLGDYAYRLASLLKVSQSFERKNFCSELFKSESLPAAIFKQHLSNGR